MNILIVEDEIETREYLSQLLNANGFACNTVGSIAAYVAWSQNQDCEILIIDRKLPDGDGLDVIKMQRQKSAIPIIVLSVLNNTSDKVDAYDFDCDVYLEKPIADAELIAVINQLKRRHINQPSTPKWLLDGLSWSLTSPKQTSIKLTHRELAILTLFVKNEGKVVKRSTIAKVLGSSAEPYDYKKLEIIIRRLRAKVAKQESELPILTIYGQGFVFNEKIAINHNNETIIQQQ